MMKKTGIKHLFQTIKKTGVTFFATAFIASVCLCIYVGFQSTGLAILNRADRYFEESQLETFEITCANGITQEDLEAIAGWEGVRNVEGGYSQSMLLDLGGERVPVQARSMLDEMNILTVEEGQLPQTLDEVAIERDMAEQLNIALGDTITLDHDEALVSDTFVVTAIVNDPVFCCSNIKDTRGRGTVGTGSNKYFVELRKDAFNTDHYEDCFTTAYIDSDVLDGIYYFSQEYETQEQDYLDRLDALAQERAELRYDTLLTDSQEKIDEAQGDIDQAQLDLEDAQRQIEDNQLKVNDSEKELQDAEQELKDGEKEYQDSEKEFQDNQQKILDGEKELEDGEKELQEKQGELREARLQLQAQLSALGLSSDFYTALQQLPALGSAGQPLQAAILEYQANEAALDEANAQLDASRRELEDGRRELEDARVELADAKIELEDGRRELEDARIELEDAKAELEDARLDVTEAEKELEDARIELEDAKADVAELQLEDWILSGRNDVGDLRAIENVVDTIKGLSLSLSCVFLLVACVVCYAAITKMINEQIAIIGAQKALGFSSKEILVHYVSYNTLCALLGIALGYLMTLVVVENLALYIFKDTFLIGSIPWAFSWSDGLITAAICLAMFLLTTYLACWKLVKQPAVDLLRGEVPTKAGKNGAGFKGFAGMSLYTKTIIKNALQDKGRMATTIIGVVGSISLLVICLSMKLSIENAAGMQFDRYFYFQNSLVFDSEEGDAQSFAQVLDEHGLSYTLVQDRLLSFRPVGEGWESTHVMIPSDAQAWKEFVKLEDVHSREELEVPEEGFLISRRVAEIFGLEEGSPVELMDSKGRVVQGQVAGIIEHYLPYHLFVCSQSYFESVMGEEADLCVYLTTGDVTGLETELVGQTGYIALQDREDYMSTTVELNSVIIVCLLLAIVMALLVLLNQIVLQINKKARELSVMRINGYTLRQTKAFVYKDNIILTIIGLLAGCGIGVALSYVVIRVVEIGACRYIRTPNLGACLFACAVGALLALVVNLIALRKINHLNLTNVSAN